MMDKKPLPESEKQKIRNKVRIVENGNAYSVQVRVGFKWVLIDSLDPAFDKWLIRVACLGVPGTLQTAKSCRNSYIENEIRKAKDEYNRHEWREVKPEEE
jgi:hypothetical protein